MVHPHQFGLEGSELHIARYMWILVRISSFAWPSDSELGLVIGHALAEYASIRHMGINPTYADDADVFEKAKGT